MFKIFLKMSEFLEISTMQVSLMTAKTTHIAKTMWGGFIWTPGSRNFYSLVLSIMSGEAEHHGKRNMQKQLCISWWTEGRRPLIRKAQDKAYHSKTHLHWPNFLTRPNFPHSHHTLILHPYLPITWIPLTPDPCHYWFW